MYSKRLKTTLTIGTVLAAAVALYLAAAPAQAGKPSGSSGTCVPSTPDVHIVNTYAWASPGSWGMPGEQLSYAIDVMNRDSGCGSSSFSVSLAAPAGFTASAPITVSVASGTDAYASGTVTSPAGVPDGTYQVTASVSRSGSSAAAATGQSVYKVYSADATAPSEYWMNPADASAITGRSTNVGFAASDDHQVTQLSIAIDGVTVASTACGNTSYECQLSYAWSTRRVSGVHTATFVARDYAGNVASTKAAFSVN